MSVVDIVILVILGIFLIKGFKNGVLKELVTFVGGVLVIVLAFFFKNPLSVLMYEHLPFFKFGGIFSGMSVINIIVYELLSFIIVLSVLAVLFKIIVAFSNLVEKVLKITVILAIPSKLLGAVVGLLEGFIVVFIGLFIGIHIKSTNYYINESKYALSILDKTPILSQVTGPVYDATMEIYNVAEEFKNSDNKGEANLKALDILLKYEILDIESADLLVEKGKINVNDAHNILDKYRGRW